MNNCLFGPAVDEYDVAVVVVALSGKLSSKFVRVGHESCGFENEAGALFIGCCHIECTCLL